MELAQRLGLRGKLHVPTHRLWDPVGNLVDETLADHAAQALEGARVNALDFRVAHADLARRLTLFGLFALEDGLGVYHLDRALPGARHAGQEKARTDGESLKHRPAEIEPARAQGRAIQPRQRRIGKNDLENPPSPRWDDARAYDLPARQLGLARFERANRDEPPQIVPPSRQEL